MAVLAHDGPAAQDDPHVDHGTGTDDGADVDDCPIITTALSPISTVIPDDGAGLDAGLEVLGVQQGMAELRLSLSTTSWSMSPAWAWRTGAMSFQSPKTILLSPQGKTVAWGSPRGLFLEKDPDGGFFPRYGSAR